MMSVEPKPNNEFPEFQSTRNEYRKLLSASLVAARSFNGTEESQNRVVEVLSRLERWMRSHVGTTSEHRLSSKDELALFELLGNKGVARSITDILNLTQVSLARILATLETEELPNEIMEIVISGVVLPTTRHRQTSDKLNAEKRESPIYQPRLKWVMELLNRNGIFLEDIIVVSGDTRPNMYRKDSYRIVEIPRLQREMLVCDQVGEATFVIDGICKRSYLTETPKEVLVELPNVVRIEQRDREMWEQSIIQALLQGKGIGEKVDTRNFEQIKAALLRQIPDEASWATCSRAQRHLIKVDGKGLEWIAPKMGIEGSPLTHPVPFMLLGLIVHGSNSVPINKRLAELRSRQEAHGQDLDALIADAKQQLPTSKDWAACKFPFRNKFHVCGCAAQRFAQKAGIAERAYDEEGWFKLGLKVYGQDDPVLLDKLEKYYQRKRTEALDAPGIKALLLKYFPTASAYVKGNKVYLYRFDFEGVGIIYAARKLGVTEADFVHDYNGYISLGKILYGDDDETMDTLLALKGNKITLEELRRGAKKSMTYQDWEEKGMKGLMRYDLYGHGLVSLARLFNIEGNPRAQKECFNALGKALFS